MPISMKASCIDVEDSCSSMRQDTMRGGVSQKVLRTRSGSAWNLVQKLLKRPRFARLGTKIASHAPMRESAWPM